MKRDLYNRLLDWKASPNRKPLVLRGARQTGKTYLLHEFGRREYQQCHYLNFEEDRQLGTLFNGDLAPDQLVGDISLYLRRPISAANDLLIFDEIQACNQALNALKYFCEQAPEYHIAAAGSLLGVRMSQPASFPVGKVDFLDLHPMTFLEFLHAVGEHSYCEYIEGLDAIRPIPEKFHADLTGLLKRYYLVGGMPEAVLRHVENYSSLEFRQTQRAILDAYTLDFAKHAPPTDIPKLSMIWESLPAQLARENKKFIFSLIRSGARAREYENALAWLTHAGLVHVCCLCPTPQIPLKVHREPSSFKLYALDVGLLGALAEIPLGFLTIDSADHEQYHGAFAESFVAQELRGRDMPLYYWKNTGRASEVDFLWQTSSGVTPIEVKAGNRIRSKSLSFYCDKYQPMRAVRLSLQNLKQGAYAANVPLYLASQLPRLLRIR